MGQLGGMWNGLAGMVPAWCPFSDGEKIIYRGLAEKIIRGIKKEECLHGESKRLQLGEYKSAEYLMQVYNRMVAESGAKVTFLFEGCCC